MEEERISQELELDKLETAESSYQTQLNEYLICRGGKYDI